MVEWPDGATPANDNDNVMIKGHRVTPKFFLVSREFPCRAKTRLMRSVAAYLFLSQDL
jgi:hypothetical protein